jgi:hypothetical protein
VSAPAPQRRHRASRRAVLLRAPAMPRRAGPERPPAPAAQPQRHTRAHVTAAHASRRACS